MSPLDGLSKSPISHHQPSENIRLDFLKSKEAKELQILEKPRIRKYTILKIFIILVLIFLISGSMYLSELIFSSNGKLASLNKFNPLRQLFSLILSPDKKIEGENQDRINLLLLGIGGEGHDGPYLTDTIMIASLKPSTKEIALISLPRDLIVEISPGRWQKINSIYSQGKVQNNDGSKLAQEVFESNFGLPIHYYAVIDFEGFVKFIDDLGGVEVNVETSFTDYSYPTDDYKVQTISFQAGPQTMDGERALKFTRSRHGSGGENSDFARSRRQQLILQAVRDKFVSFETLVSPKKISSFFNLLHNHIETNLKTWEVLRLSKIAKEINNEQIYRLVFDDSPGNFLEPALTEEAGYILKPIEGNFTKIQLVIKNIFDTGKIKAEAANIEIQNGTEAAGLAYYTAQSLEKASYNISQYGNAASQDYQKTIIYDLTGGQKPETLKSLEETFKAEVFTDIPEIILEKYRQSVSITDGQQTVTPDLILVLGQDYAQTFRIPEFTQVSTSTASSTPTSTEELLDNNQEENLNQE